MYGTVLTQYKFKKLILRDLSGHLTPLTLMKGVLMEHLFH